MSKIVEVPGMGNVEFPDEMDDGQITQAINTSLKAKLKGAQPPQAPAGLTSPHMTSWSGGPESAKREGWGLLAAPLSLGAGQVASKTIPQIPKIARLGGEMVGSVGTKGLEAGTEGRLPTKEETGWAASYPMLGRIVSGAIGLAGKGLGHVLPGRQYAMQEDAVKRMRNVPNMVQGEESQPLFNQFNQSVARQGAVNVPTPNLNQKVLGAKGELADLVASLRAQKLDRLADDLEALMSTTGTVPIDVLKKNLSKIGVLTQKGQQAGVEAGIIKQLYKGGKLDIEALAGSGNTQAQLLNRGTEAYKREQVRKRLGDITEANVRNREGFEYTTPDTVLNVLKKPKVAERILDMITPQERSAIMKELQELAKVPSLPQQNTWWSWARRAPGAIVGGAAGTPGGLPGTVVGGLAGAEFLDAVEWVMKTPSGRNAVRRLLSNQMGSGPLSGAVGAAVGHTVD